MGILHFAAIVLCMGKIFRHTRIVVKGLVMSTPASPAQTHRSAFVETIGFVILMGLLTAFDPLSIDMYLSAFPSIQQDFQTSYALVELSLSAFFIGMAFGQLAYGPLADRYGRKRPLILGMGLYMLATLGCGLSTRIEMLIAFRVLQAFGGCAGMVITRAIVRDLFPRERSASFFSSLMLVMGLAPILAPLIGSFVNQAWGWRAIFFTLSGLNFLCMLSIAFLLPETLHPPSRRALPFGQVLRAYFHLGKSREFLSYVLPDAFIRAGMFAYIAGSPFVFIELLGVQQQNYGWIFGSNALGLIAASQANRFVLRRLNSDQILKTVLPFSAAAALTLLILPQVYPSAWSVFIPLFFFIMSLGWIGPNSIAGALAHQGHQAGMASALYGTIQWSVAALSSFAVSHLHNGTMLPMTGTIAVCGVCSFLAFQLGAVLRNQKLTQK
jgi:DHA1 family bicyclomycin/chloramphenicol resistance-like MFS transporter